MSEVSICTAKVALAGDIRNVVHRGTTNPVTFPEVEVLAAIHGEDAVTDVAVIRKGDTTIKEEFARLQLKYGAVVGQLFPGARPAMSLVAPKEIPRVKATTVPAVVKEPKAKSPFDDAPPEDTDPDKKD